MVFYMTFYLSITLHKEIEPLLIQPTKTPIYQLSLALTSLDWQVMAWILQVTSNTTRVLIPIELITWQAQSVY